MTARFPLQVTVPVSQKQYDYLEKIKTTSKAEEIRRMIDAEMNSSDRIEFLETENKRLQDRLDGDDIVDYPQ